MTAHHTLDLEGKAAGGITDDVDKRGHIIGAGKEEDIVAVNDTEFPRLNDPRELTLHPILERDRHGSFEGVRRKTTVQGRNEIEGASGCVPKGARPGWDGS
jgi:hypothetical protein